MESGIRETQQEVGGEINGRGGWYLYGAVVTVQ